MGWERRTAAKPARTVERRCPVRSATRAGSVPGSAGRLLPRSRRPRLSRALRVPRPTSASPSLRPGHRSRRRRHSRPPGHHPPRPNRCSRRSPGLVRPGTGWSRHPPRGVPRNRHPHLTAGQARHPRRHPLRRPLRLTSPPGRKSPDHRRVPRLRTCWHHYSHPPLRAALNRRPHSALPWSRPPCPSSGQSHHLRWRSSRRRCLGCGLGRRLRSYSRHRIPTPQQSRLPSQPRRQHLHHRSPRSPGPR
jgi:hypothetical protein